VTRWTGRGSRRSTSKDRNFTRATLTQFIKAADAKLDDYLQRLEKSDASERTTGGSRVKNLAEKITAIRERREHMHMAAVVEMTVIDIEFAD